MDNNTPDPRAFDTPTPVKDRSWLRKTIMLGIATVTFSLGLYFTYCYIASIPPDPKHDDTQTVLDYFLSSHFDNLSDAERLEYIQAMMNRYKSMTDDQRKLAESALKAHRKKHPEQTRERMIQMWKDYAVGEAQRYVQIPPEQRQQWLEGRLALWRAMGRAPGGKRAERRAHKGRDETTEPITPERQVEIVGFFQKQIMPRTSAKDRALVSLMARDASHLIDR